MIKINESFPIFTLETYDPSSQKSMDVSLSEYKGKWLVLFFYPADFTFVCPTELRDLIKKYPEIRKFNAEVLAVSTDTVYTHKAWAEAERLLQGMQFRMSADHAGVLARELGIFNEKSGMADRAVYIIDPDGMLRAYEIVTDNIGRSATEIVRKLKALEYVRNNPGHACPVSWDTDGKDLKKGLDISGKVYEALEK